MLNYAKGSLKPGLWLGHILEGTLLVCHPTLYSYELLEKTGGAVRIKCGKVSRLLSVIEGMNWGLNTKAVTPVSLGN